MGRTQLVGRRVELATLQEAIDDARAGQGGLTLLVGEPGIGKSRLVEQAARIATEAGFAVAWGRAWETGGAPPYWPWIQVLRSFGAAAAQRLAEARGGEDRFLLFDAAARDMLATCAKPSLAILEDLHAVDEASLHFLAFLVAQMRGTHLLVIGTFRDVEARMTPAANAVLEKLARSARLIAPRRLEAMDVLELATDLGLDAETIAALHRQSEGNPLFVTELLRVIERRGVGSGPLPVPSGVRSAIREHLRAMPTVLVPILEAASVVGREQAATIVAELCAQPIASVLDILRVGVELGVLVDRGTNRFAFAHGLIAETLHHDLPAERRIQLHLAVATALERDHGPLAEIAHHLFEAGPDHAERAAEVARRAAEQARKQLAFEPAGEILERALAIAPAANAPLRFELLRMLGEVRMLADDIARGKDACRDAAAVARTLGSPELLARAALTYGGGLTFGVTDQVLVQLLEESLAALPEGDSPLRARMMARLASALQPAYDTRPPMDLARAAIEMANRIGDERTRLEVTYAAVGGLVLFAPPAERRVHNIVVRELATKLDEPVVGMRAEMRLIFDHAELGDFDGMRAHLAAYDALVARLRLPKARWASAMVRGMMALAQGRTDDYLAATAEAQRNATEANDGFFDVGRKFQLLVRNLMDHDIDAIRRNRDAHAAHARITGKFVYNDILAMLALRLGELDEARSLMTREYVEFVKTHRLLMVGVWSAEVIWRTDAKELAPIVYDWLAAEGPRFATLQMHGFVFGPPAAYGAMLLAATMGDDAAARRHYDVAAAAIRAIDGKPLLAILEREWAAIGARPEHVQTVVVDQVQLRCDGEYWTVEGLGVTCTVKASRGIEMLAKLVADPSREVHVLDLSREGEGATDTGDAGEALDAEAKKAYKRRILELRETLEEAEGWNDTVRAERARDELEALEAELVRATGLGGKTRRVGRAAERARINVQRRVADAIKRITEAAPVIGNHLAGSVKTGVYCSYTPERASRRAGR